VARKDLPHLDMWAGAERIGTTRMEMFVPRLPAGRDA
jgi:hypothetical protein